MECLSFGWRITLKCLHNASTYLIKHFCTSAFANAACGWLLIFFSASQDLIHQSEPLVLLPSTGTWPGSGSRPWHTRTRSWAASKRCAPKCNRCTAGWFPSEPALNKLKTLEISLPHPCTLIEELHFFYFVSSPVEIKICSVAWCTDCGSRACVLGGGLQKWRAVLWNQTWNKWFLGTYFSVDQWYVKYMYLYKYKVTFKFWCYVCCQILCLKTTALLSFSLWPVGLQP